VQVAKKLKNRIMPIKAKTLGFIGKILHNKKEPKGSILGSLCWTRHASNALGTPFSPKMSAYCLLHDFLTLIVCVPANTVNTSVTWFYFFF